MRQRVETGPWAKLNPVGLLSLGSLTDSFLLLATTTQHVRLSTRLTSKELDGFKVPQESGSLESRCPEMAKPNTGERLTRGQFYVDAATLPAQSSLAQPTLALPSAAFHHPLQTRTSHCTHTHTHTHTNDVINDSNFMTLDDFAHTLCNMMMMTQPQGHVEGHLVGKDVLVWSAEGRLA